MKKFLTRRTVSLVLAGMMVFSGGYLAHCALAATASARRTQVISGEVDARQVLYTIPQDAPDTVVLDGRQMIDFLLSTGQPVVPGSWMGGWLGVRNQSGHRYRVTDVSFQIDHSARQADSAILKNLDFNPYLIGPLHVDRPSSVRKGSTGVTGFDGAEIPKSMAVLRSPSNALTRLLGASGNHDVSLHQAIQAGENEGFEQQILDYYRNHAKFSRWMQGVHTLSELPQECLVDLLGGTSYRLWQADDPTGRGRWHEGDIKLFAQNTEGRSVPVYAVYDDEMIPAYYYVDRNFSGMSAPDTRVDTKQANLSLIAPSWEASGNPFFEANRIGSIQELPEGIAWQAENGNGYLLETNPEILKLAYERFYSDLLSFTFDSEKVPLIPGEQELRIDRENGRYTWSEITEGSEGLHWLDYMRKNEAASRAIENTVGAWTFAPAGADDGGDYHCAYTNLKLSGQNTTNNYAGTDHMRGLTFTITLERVEEPVPDSSSTAVETGSTEEPTHPDAGTTAPATTSGSEPSSETEPATTSVATTAPTGAPTGVTSPSKPQEPGNPVLPDTGRRDTTLYLMAVVFVAAAVGLIAMAADQKRRDEKTGR